MTDRERQKKKRQSLVTEVIVISVVAAVIGIYIGAAAAQNPGMNIIDVISTAFSSFPNMKPFPTDIRYILGTLLISSLLDVYLWQQYVQMKDVTDTPQGDASFMENVRDYDRQFVIDPDVVQKVTGKKPATFYTADEHKKVVKTPHVSNARDRKHHYKDKVYEACWKNCQIYADGVALSLNGKWCQRNTNTMIFGGSGAGKTRFFLSPNLLQANSNYIITDPSGEIMAGFGAFLKEQGYRVKCLNVADMTKSCRFNPLYYIHNETDIPIIVNTLMENTQKTKNSGGDDFWPKTTQALLCAIIGYLYEVEPLERRNFANVLEILRMAPVSEDGSDEEDTEFDKLFKALGEKNPNSYAYHQYQTYSLAPAKTALSILISTAVLLSTYVDIADFNNLVFKDEMELDKIGAAPFFDKDTGEVIDVEDFDEDRVKKDEQGRIIEGEPYKMAIFLAIPTADPTYNWLTAMLYSVLFRLTYRRGEMRQNQQLKKDPELAYPTRFLIDECANIGKIPNLQEYMATCRKYRISIVPIFQSFSQITKVYGKEDANSLYANCDTTVFLGGIDPETLKVVCERLGKETVKSMNTGISGAGNKKSGSKNFQTVGRELMSRVQLEQMSNSECVVLIRAVKPFRVKKYPLQEHPNYKYTAENDPEHYSFANPFVLKYDDAEIESVRIKKIGEEGYNAPKEVKSARLTALKAEKKNERIAEANGLADAAKTYARFDPDEYPDGKERKQQEGYHDQFVSAVKDAYRAAQKADDRQCLEVISGIIIDYEMQDETGIRPHVRSAEAKTPERHKVDMAKAEETFVGNTDWDHVDKEKAVISDAYSAYSGEPEFGEYEADEEILREFFV